MEKYSKLIGTPYEVLDCYGVAREFYKLEFGIILNSYYENPQDIVPEKMIKSSLGDFKQVETPRYGDLLLMLLDGIPRHIAIYISDEHILHTRKNVGCMLDRYQKWKNLIVGVYRP